jgi:hypothetical protein
VTTWPPPLEDMQSIVMMSPTACPTHVVLPDFQESRPSELTTDDMAAALPAVFMVMVHPLCVISVV